MLSEQHSSPPGKPYGQWKPPACTDPRSLDQLLIPWRTYYRVEAFLSTELPGRTSIAHVIPPKSTKSSGISVPAPRNGFASRETRQVVSRDVHHGRSAAEGTDLEKVYDLRNLSVKVSQQGF